MIHALILWYEIILQTKDGLLPNRIRCPAFLL